MFGSLYKLVKYVYDTMKIGSQSIRRVLHVLYMEWYRILCPRVRVDRLSGQLSVYDLMASISKDGRQASETFKRLRRIYPELRTGIQHMRIDGKGRLTPMADPLKCKQVLSCMIAGAKLPSDTKSQLLKVIDTTVHMRHYTESEVLGPVTTALGHLGPLQQFSVGSYRIDLYFPKHRLAVECDEHGHMHYDATKEAARQQFIESQLNCKFHRFDPYAEGFCVYNLISQLVQLLYSK